MPNYEDLKKFGQNIKAKVPQKLSYPTVRQRVSEATAGIRSTGRTILENAYESSQRQMPGNIAFGRTPRGSVAFNSPNFYRQPPQQKKKHKRKHKRRHRQRNKRRTREAVIINGQLYYKG